QEGRSGVAADRRRTARQARRFYGLFAVAVGVLCLVLTVVRLAMGDGAGMRLVFYAGGVAASAVGAWLAWRGRTRWALAVVALGVACASLGDNPGLK
ncbi:hypothetical protein P8605_02125, partial [Streptomyces sp. T-3]|nr:hypothetical protein [Streptomyces sp. T-3]